MEIIGLLFDVIFCIIGLYVFLLLGEVIKPQNPKLIAFLNQFEPGWKKLLAYSALVLTALATINTILHFISILSPPTSNITL